MLFQPPPPRVKTLRFVTGIQPLNFLKWNFLIKEPGVASCPPCAPAGLSELFIFTDGSASPPARPDASARLGWSAVCVGRCGAGYHFLGALFHGMAGSGDVVQHDPVGDSNTMELAAMLGALVWVVISCPPCSVCIATDSVLL